MQVANKYQIELPKLKKYVENSLSVDRHNYERFNFFRKFIFDTSLSKEDLDLLKELDKPQIEFNIGEPYISRLLGEFYKQEPSIEVSAIEGEAIDPLVIQITEDHLRYVLDESNKNNFQYEIYKDQLSGGFSSAKISTRYLHAMTRKQEIYVEKTFDSTLVGFDSNARFPTKSDGKYSFEIYPKMKEEVGDMYPKVDLTNVSFSRNLDGFSWSFCDDNQDMLLVCDMYLMKKKKLRVYDLINDQTLSEEDYKNFIMKWEEDGNIAQPPAVIGKPRWVQVPCVYRYVFIEDQILEFEETDYDFLPHIYFPGNDIVIREGAQGNVKRMSRPYLYHIVGAQKLKNFAGQSLANELENMVMHKWMAAEQSIPQQEDFLQAWMKPQQASVFVYNAFNNDNPDQPIPPPREIQRTPTPPEVTNTFTLTDQVIQNAVGTFDAQLGVNEKDLSGIAMIESITQSNAVAMPFIVGHLQGLEQLANNYVKLMPKYITTPRSLPIIRKDGTRDFVLVNQQGGIKLDFDKNALRVKVKAGSNFRVEKNKALMQITAMMGASEKFAKFMADEGLDILLDNMEFRNVDLLKEKVKQWSEKQKEIEAKQMQQQEQMMQQNPLMMRNQLEAQKLQQKTSDSQMRLQKDMEELKQNQLKIFSDLKIAHDNNQVQALKANTERFSKEVELILDHNEQKHRHAKDIAEFNHKVNSQDNSIT